MKALLFVFLLQSCMPFLKMTDKDFYESIDTKGKVSQLNLVFSHNINGETHPCGCRNFPLGGIPQAAGKLYSLKKEAPLLYVDTGDTLFPSNVVPESLKESQTFTANKIAEALDKQGLKFFTPGDQDFALGEKFLADLSRKVHFSFLISNLNLKKSTIKASPWKIINFGEQKLIFLGIVNPDIMNQYSELFISPEAGIKKALKEIKEKGHDKNSRIILLSHSGVDFDVKMAKTFPQISWIIGSHTQSFYRIPKEEGKTKIVQVLSRNHYLGHIKFPLSLKEKASYELIENRDELKDLWKKNPFISWLDLYKKDLEKIQKKEQDKLTENFSQTKSAQTYGSCVDCHSNQVEFWEKTPHSLAFITLHKNQAANNPNCIGCHSLNYKQGNGFSSKKDIIISDKDHSQYWKEFNTLVKKTKPVKDMKEKTRAQISQKWRKLDEKFEVSHNFANVQCLNCHTKAGDHPFESSTVKVDKNYKDKCLQCHTTDQSPSWYDKDSKGIATTLNIEYFKQKLKKVACPKNE